MSKRPTRIGSKVNRVFHTLSERKFSGAHGTGSEEGAPPASQSVEKVQRQLNKRKMTSFIDGVDARKENRLQSFISFGLWPVDKAAPQDDEFQQKSDTLWQTFATEALGSQCIPKLQQFLILFNPRFLVWNEEFELDCLQRPDILKKSFFIPYITLVEAEIVADMCCGYINNIVDAVRANGPFFRLHGTEVLYMMNLLSRVVDNRLLFSSSISRILPALVSLIKLLLIGYKIPFNEDMKNSGPEKDLAQLFSQVLLANSFQIILNFTTFNGLWGVFDTVSFSELYSENNRELITKSKKELFSLGILNIIKGYLDHFNNISAKQKLQGSQVDFRLFVLNALGALIDGYPEANSNLIQVGVLDTIVGWINWPDLYSDTQDFELSAVSEPSLRDEYRLQLLCLQIFACAVQDCPQNIQRIMVLGGWNNVQTFVLWTAEVFSINPLLLRERLSDTVACGTGWNSAKQSTSLNCFSGSKVVSGGEASSPSYHFQVSERNQLIPPQLTGQYTRELTEIFSLLFVICTADDGGSSVGVSPFITQRNGREVEEIPVIPAVGARVVMDLLVSLFVHPNYSRYNSHVTRIREKLCNDPELQLLVLELVSKSLGKVKNFSVLCERYKLWEIILFSKFFYGCGTNGLQEGAIPELGNTKHICSKVSNRVELINHVRSFSIDLIVYAGSKSELSPMNICEQFLELINLFPHDLHQISLALNSLVTMLKYNLYNTQIALKRLNAMPIFAMIVQQQQTISGVYCNLENGTMPFSKELFLQSRFVVLSVISHMFTNNDDLRVYAIRDSRIVNVLFSLLFEPDIRKYALQQVINLISVDVEQHAGSNTTVAKESAEYLEILFEKYYSLFERCQKGSLPTHFQLLMMLLDGVNKVVELNPQAAKLFRKTGAFDHLLSLLHKEKKPKRFPKLFLAVLNAIRALIEQNDSNQNYFRDEIGFSSLQKFIQQALPCTEDSDLFCEELVKCMFSILVGGNYKTEEHETHTIQYPDFILFMFTVILDLPLKYQERLIRQFIKLVVICPLNQSICCSKLLIFHVLEQIPRMKDRENLLPPLFSLIEVLGTHSITVKELKRLFLLLKSQPGNFRPFMQLRLMKSLQFMALSQKSTGPQTFFDLNGKTSAIVVPPLEKWPPHHGYAFCLWIRVESLQDHLNRQESYHPRLVSFLDQDGFGIEIFLSRNLNTDDSFFIEMSIVSLGGKASSHIFNSIPLRIQNWYLLIITHRNHNRKFKIGESEVKLYVNSSVQSKASLKYPQFPPILNKLRVGTNVEIQGSGRKLYRTNYFHGQLGPFFLFDDHITSQQVKFLQEKFCGGQFALAGTSSFADLESKIRLYYNCTARVGKFFLDLAPQNAERSMDAKMIGKLHVCRTRDIKDIIHCIGGIKVLLPLFAQLDQPEKPNQSSLGEQSTSSIDYSINRQVLLQCLGLLGDMLSRSTTNQKEMFRCQGFRVIGFLIEQSSPQHLSSETLLTLEDLGHKISNSKNITDELWKYVIFRWSMWIYAPAAVQWELANLLLTICTDYPIKAKSLFSVQDILDTLYYYYWFDRRGIIGAMGKTPFYHPVTKEIVGTRPSTEELGPIRRCLLNSLKKMIKSGISSQEARAIVSSIIETVDLKQVIELLILTHDLLIIDRVPQFAQALLDACDTQLFLMILRNDSDDVRVVSLLIIGHLNSFKKGKAQEQDLLMLINILQVLTPRIYQSLFGLVVGNRDVDTTLIDENIVIKESRFLSVIFGLLKGTDALLRQQVLQGIYLLLCNSPHNRSMFVADPHWQEWLFSVLVHTHISPSSLSSSSTDEQASNQVTQEMVLLIFKVALSHVIAMDKNAYQIIQETFSYIQILNAKGLIDKEKVFKIIFGGVFETYVTGSFSFRSIGRKDISSSSKDQLNIHLNNIIQLIALQEDFLFYSPLAEEIEILQHQASNNDDNSVSDLETNDLLSKMFGNKQIMQYSPTKTVTHRSLHIDKSNEKTPTWNDLQFAHIVLNAVFEVDLFNPTLSGVIEQILLGKDFPKNPNQYLRNGGFAKIVLHIALTIMNFGDIKYVVETIPRLRQILAKDIQHSRNDPTPRLCFALSFLLIILKREVNHKQQGSDAFVDKAKAIVPLVKDLLRLCKSVVPSVSEKDIIYFSESCTIPQFLKSFETPQWNPIIQWAQQCVSDASIDENSSSCSSIDKKRIKTSISILQVMSKQFAARTSCEQNLNDSFQHVHKVILQPEIRRKREIAIKRKEEKITVQRIWRNLLRSLTNERAPWASNDEGKIYWKLDKTENISRMRLKMKRNYNYDLHVGCARDTQEQSFEDSCSFDDPNLKLPKPLASLSSGMNLLDMNAGESQELGGKGNTDDFDSNLIHDDAPQLQVTSHYQQQQQPEKIVYRAKCELITPLNVITGHLEISTQKLHFIEDMNDTTTNSNDLIDIENITNDNVGSSSLIGTGGTTLEIAKELKISFLELKEVHLRRYLLRPSALEIFLVNRSNYFFNFNKRERTKVYSKIMGQNPPNLSYFETASPQEILSKSDLTRKWQLRLISNFDYLMQLNTIAGRSYNDITQYPVFPWVLKDYSSSSLDLKNPDIYRDLSKPIGALEPERLEQFVLRYENFCDDIIPQFHYGSHYSSAGIVLFYLIRSEPFTTHFIQLQGGKFDHADRMFDSIPNCWNNVLTNAADVKELIPEFYYFPYFLENKNNVSFGTLQNGSPLHHVELPNWASTPEEFVYLHRQALESEYVSLHLHEWIDLIFGYKQRGQAAIDAHNVFYYLTYEGAVDLDAIEDEYERKATESQIDNFGQTPAQLMTRNHPKRLAFHESHQNIFTRIVHQLKPQVYPIHIASDSDSIAFVCMPAYYFHSSPIQDFDVTQIETLVTITKTRFVGNHKFSVSPHISSAIATNQFGFTGIHSSTTINSSLQSPFQIQIDPSFIPSQNAYNLRRKFGAPFAADILVNSNCFACTSDASIVLSCGHWDFSAKCCWLDGSKPTQSLSAHKDIVTCLALGVDSKTFVTGSKDTTLLVWEIQYQKGIPFRVDENPLHVLYGHNDDVTCVTLDIALDICVSGSRDGTCIIHNLRQGTYLRSIYHPHQFPIQVVSVSPMGHIVFFSKMDKKLYVYSINGDMISCIDAGGIVTDIFISKDSEYIVTGDMSGSLKVYQLFSMRLIQVIPVGAAVVSITLTPDEICLIVALANGSISVVLVEEHAQHNSFLF